MVPIEFLSNTTYKAVLDRDGPVPDRATGLAVRMENKIFDEHVLDIQRVIMCLGCKAESRTSSRKRRSSHKC